MLVPRKSNLELFDDLFSDSIFKSGNVKIMKTDIIERDGKYIFNIDVPGYDKDEIKISLDNGYLTVSASMKKDIQNVEGDKYVHIERYSGNCSRTFYVGEGINESDIKAKFNNGMLSIEMPIDKKEEEPKVKYIDIM